MNESSDTLDEQLSAFMDGELPEAQARFLLRRIEHDQTLRSKWERLHLAGACLRGQAWSPVAPALSNAVREGIARPDPVAPAVTAAAPPRPYLGWAVAASVAVLALAFGPRLSLSPEVASPPATVAAASGTALAPSPSTADLVAIGAASRVAATVPPASRRPADSAPITAPPAAGTAVAADDTVAALSPSEFPLVEHGGNPGWPRSGLAGNDDPALEAYLVRHNQMLAADGLGGFVPYVDVVASGTSALPAAAGPDEEARIDENGDAVAQ